MSIEIVQYRDWVFEVDRESTKSTYFLTSAGGADTCTCDNCKNYVAYRDKLFPDEILSLFIELGIDYRKDVEVYTLINDNGQCLIGGWYHFIGKIVTEPNPSKELLKDGYLIINDLFCIDINEGCDYDLSLFNDKTQLVQINFSATIPWLLDKKLGTEN